MLKLIDTPAGERPLRTVIDPLAGGRGPKAMNRAAEQVQRELLRELGTPELARIGGGD